MCYALIKFNSMNDVYSFIDIINQFPGDYEIIDGHHVINAKSLLNILSMNLSNPLKLILDSEHADDILRAIQPFILHE
ncbi:PTS HPr component phosphorylation site [Anaerostipes sp. 494a]|uniref:HPr family phosphocarrier protein n=1 Tax=Anaerostipes sp. 494a TaxID=1261636 RepID=UPI000951B59A|nr:HPr family phosphocarrier protein [Anaerostipes sp. 494a]OLR58325.1 PTS HPr component phosphorylation site [Anaerostipes sp. 494a]